MKETVKKYIIPNEKNAYKPHLLRKGGLALVAGLATLIFALGVFQTTLLTKTDFLSAVIAKVLVSLANENRSDYDLSDLSPNTLLQAAAEAKAKDMAAKGYFAHNSPDGTTPWHWIRQSGYKFAYAGENLAVNFSDSEDVDDAWMASPGHRANILNGKFTEIGIATAKGRYKGRDTVFVVQMFGRPSESVALNIEEESAPEASGALALSDEEESNVLGESARLSVTQNDEETSDQVLSETETFIALENVEEVNAPAESPVPSSANPIEELATSPKQVVNTLHVTIMGLLILAIALTVGIELRRQHLKNVFAGLALLAFVILLSYIYRTAFFTAVTVI